MVVIKWEKNREKKTMTEKKCMSFRASKQLN